jgi:Domain of unknown function (DUF4232)
MAEGHKGTDRTEGTAVIVRPGSSRTRWAVTALACLAALAMAGCGSSSSSSTPSSGASSSSPTPATSTLPPTPVQSTSPGASPHVVGAPACPNGSLKVTQGLGQGYAGGTYQVIDFTNTSGSECTLTGYPGVSLVSGPPYVQIGLAAKRGGTAPVTAITLAPGATANALLQIVDALNFPTATCSPAKATALQIYPPNQTAAVYLTYQSEACAEPVQVLFISAVQAGSGGSA